MQPDITIKMKGGIHGVLTYRNNEGEYYLNIEYTGDYRDGIYIQISDLEKQIQGSNSMKIKSEMLRNIQMWAKQNNEKVCW